MQRYTDLDTIYIGEDEREWSYGRITYDRAHASGKLVDLEFRIASKDPLKLRRTVASRRQILQRMKEMNEVHAV